ncbi:MAG: hypothetical protein ACOH12_03230 [Parvibaculaceae bacterium]
MSKLEHKIRHIRNFPSGRIAVSAAAFAVLATGLAACSATPDAVKPAAIYGQSAPAPTPEGTKGFPELANTPDQRPATTSAADRKAIADELMQDRATAQDKDSALRAGQAGSVAAKPSAQRQAEIDKAANSETAAIVPSAPVKPAPVVAAAPAPEKPKPVAVAAAAPKPAPVAAPAPEPVKVAAAEPAPAAKAEPAKAEPVRQLATLYVAPKLAAEPAAAAPATGTDALLAKVEAPAPADKTQMASADMTTEPVASPAVAAPIVNGIIPMPARGGHKTLAAVMTMPAEAGEGGEPTKKAEPEAAAVADPNAEAPVSAAPTTKVDVKPAPAPTAP